MSALSGRNSSAGGSSGGGGNVTPADGVTTPTNASNVQAFLQAFNGTTSDRLRNGSAANLSRTLQSDALVTTNPGEWTLFSSAVGGAQATVSKAAGGAAVRHVCTGYLLTLYNGTGVSYFEFAYLRDGATGAGTILSGSYLGNNPGLSGALASPRTNIYGSLNTAMTVEFANAGGASVRTIVGANGYSVQ